VRRYETFELTFQGEPPNGSNVDVDLAATFEQAGIRTEVRGFHAGDGRYIVRYLPLDDSPCRYEVRGLFEMHGEVDCGTASSDAHGPVRAVGTRFVHADGTRFLAFGTTVYALLHQKPALIERTMATLHTAPFNKVRLCIFPKSFDYNQNEPSRFAFERIDGAFDFDRPVYVFWDELETRIRELDRLGIQADLILFHPYDRWGFAKMDRPQCHVYLDYLTRRLSALPNVWWSLANEYDLLDGFAPEWWVGFARSIRASDPVGHPLSNHNFLRFWDFSNPDASHCSLQSSDTHETQNLLRRFGKPVVFDEMGYEGNIPHPWGNLSAFELVDRFWKAFVNGGHATHGETFLDADEILWWSKGGELKGESPARIGFLKSLLESLPGSLEPVPSGLADADDPFEFIRKELENPDSVLFGNPVFQHLLTITEEEMRRMLRFFRVTYGRIGDQVRLRYFGRECTALGTLDLPSDATYTIDVVDAWNMTRRTVRTDASGMVEIELPGREGTALLAIRNEA
jgi:hypothetical protein